MKLHKDLGDLMLFIVNETGQRENILARRLRKMISQLDRDKLYLERVIPTILKLTNRAGLRISATWSE